ncbi:MAG: BatA domain-containing protein [Bacteroidota bacterium]
MQFVNPLFLIALGTLAIPVLIHLFNFRKFKKVYFTNVRFLREIQQETKKQSQLRQLLILAARLLAITALVFAFAQPYIPAIRQQKRITGQRAVTVYIDNSFSMEAASTEGRLFEVAKARALEIASAYTPSDLFNLVTNDFEGRHQRFVSREEFVKLVEEVQVSAAARPISEVVRRQSDLLSETQKMNFDAYLLSDFQKSTASIGSAKPDSSMSWFLVPLTAGKRDNLFIDTVYFLSPVHQPGQPVRLMVRIRNASGESPDKVPVKLTINSVQKAVSSFAAGPNSTTDVVLSYTENSSGIQYGQVEIADYPIVYDDKYFFSYSVLPSVPMLCINEKESNNFLDALFTGDSTVRYTKSPVKQLDYGNIFTNSLVILNSPEEVSSGLAQELNRFVKNGGNLAVFPPAKGNIDSYNAMLSLFSLRGYSPMDTVRQRIAVINTESEIYNGVFEKNGSGKVVLPDNIDLPWVYRHYQISMDVRSGAEILLKLQNNQPFLVSVPAGKGKVYLFASPLDEEWSRFPNHMIFVPTLYKIALLSNPVHPLAYIIGESQSVAIPDDSLNETNFLKISRISSSFEFIPETRRSGTNLTLILHDQVKDAGFYAVNAGTRQITGLSFNYNRKESDLDCFTASELEDQVKRLSSRDIHIIKGKKSSIVSEIKQIRQGTPLWKLFIILALVFLGVEAILIRLLK